MRKIFRSILISSGLAINLFFALSCTPQSKLNRLLARYPELVKKDTIFILKPFIVDGFEADTTFNKYTNSTIIDSVFTTIYCSDTVFLPKFKTIFKKIYETKPCLTDTVFFTLKNKSKIKLYEKNNRFYLNITAPEQRFEIKAPVITNTITAKNKDRFQNLFLTFLVGLIIGLLTILINKNKNG